MNEAMIFTNFTSETESDSQDTLMSAWITRASSMWYYIMISIDTNTILVTISTETRDKHISSQSYWDLCMKWNKKQWLTDQLKSDDELDFEIIEVEQFKHKIL